MPLATQWFLWGGLIGLFWFIALVTLGILTIKNGHIVLFILGFILPLIWIIGAAWRKPPERY